MTTDPTDLHRDIMNLPCKGLDQYGMLERLAYKDGHRDARHDAAELVAAWNTRRASPPAAPTQDPVAWMIEYIAPGSMPKERRRVVYLVNAIGDYRALDPDATVTPLYATPAAPRDLSDEDVDAILSTSIPGGSAARDWFLPHEAPKGLANVRNVVRAMVARAVLRAATTEGGA